MCGEGRNARQTAGCCGLGDVPVCWGVEDSTDCAWVGIVTQGWLGRLRRPALRPGLLSVAPTGAPHFGNMLSVAPTRAAIRGEPAKIEHERRRPACSSHVGTSNGTDLM